MSIRFTATGTALMMLLSIAPHGLARDLRCPDGANMHGGLPPDDTKWGCLKYDMTDEPIRHGFWTEWYLNGQKQQEGTYFEGHRNGHWVWWYPNGIKMREGDYIKGAPTGNWSFWKENGAPAAPGRIPAESKGISLSDLAQNMRKDFK